MTKTANPLFKKGMIQQEESQPIYLFVDFNYLFKTLFTRNTLIKKI